MNADALFISFDILAESYRYLRESQNKNSNIENIKIQWSQNILSRLNTQVEIIGTPAKAKSIILVGNHISYLDIPLLMATTPQISFVAKAELSRWPIFGAGAKKIDTVFVKRENGDSRKSARLAVQNAVADGKRVVIFPSGTTCLSENKLWRQGAFNIAHDLGVQIQPFRISYTPLREVAYIDRDFFPVHLYKLSCAAKVEAKIEFHDLVDVTDPQPDSAFWQKWSRGLLNAKST